MTLWLLLILAALALASWLVRRREAVRSRPSRGDDIDRDVLERAEEEVRDLDIHTRPEEGFVGDDWGPGTPRG